MEIDNSDPQLCQYRMPHNAKSIYSWFARAGVDYKMRWVLRGMLTTLLIDQP